MTTTTNYAVENRREVVVHTFDEPAAAHRWARENTDRYGPLHVVAVITSVIRLSVGEDGRLLGAPSPLLPGPCYGRCDDRREARA